MVDGAGTGEAGEAGVLERSVEKESRGNTKGSAAALSLGVMRAGGWQPPRAPRGATQSDMPTAVIYCY